MNDVVERVARAICVAMGDDPDREGPDWAAEAYGSVARAAKAVTDETLKRVRTMLFDEHAPLLQVVEFIDAALADASPDIGKEGIGNE